MSFTQRGTRQTYQDDRRGVNQRSDRGQSFDSGGGEFATTISIRVRTKHVPSVIDRVARNSAAMMPDPTTPTFCGMQGAPIFVALSIETRYSVHLINTSTSMLRPKLRGLPAIRRLEIYRAT